jgi:hypothetical protein
LRFFQNSSAVASPREAVLITNRTPPDGGSNLVLQWFRWSEKEATQDGITTRINAEVLAYVLPGIEPRIDIQEGNVVFGNVIGMISGMLIPTDIVVGPDPT